MPKLNYWDKEKWIVLNKSLIFDFKDNPIEVVYVQVGENNGVPVTRWMTIYEYERNY